MVAESKKQTHSSRQKVTPFEYDPNRIAFEQAYKGFGRSHRAIAREEFCKAHGIQEQSFYAKLCGVLRVYGSESNWMQSFNPYAK